VPSNHYVTGAIIDAPPDVVWAILTRGEGYAEWNPEIVNVEGRFALKQRIKVSVRLGNGAVRRLSLKLTAYETGARMVWTGGLPLGLFVGTRTLTVTPQDGGTEFRMALSMTGPLAPLILKSLGDRQPDIDAFSAGLKKVAERA
jgi:uncharacterized protein YndB with AHSA1/START domain